MASKRKGPLEKEIQSAILHYLWSLGYPAFHIPNHGKFNPVTKRYNIVGEDHVPGVPDIVCPCLEGRTAYFEVKSAAGATTQEQYDYGIRLIKMGHNYMVVRSVAEVRQHLAAWGLSRERK